MMRAKTLSIMSYLLLSASSLFSQEPARAPRPGPRAPPLPVNLDILQEEVKPAVKKTKVVRSKKALESFLDSRLESFVESKQLKTNLPYYELLHKYDGGFDNQEVLDWISDKVKQTPYKDPRKNLERDRYLDLIIRDFLPEVRSNSTTNRRGLSSNQAIRLSEDYLELVDRHKSDPDFIARGLDATKGFLSLMDQGRFRTLYGNKKYEDKVFSFYGKLVNCVGNLENKKIDQTNKFNREMLLDLTFSIPGFDYVAGKDREFQDKMADVISKNYFKKNHGDLNGMNEFIFSCTQLIRKHPKVKWSNYMAMKLTVDNFDYFESGAHQLLRDMKENGISNKKLDNLADLVNFLNEDIHFLIPWPGYPNKDEQWGWDMSPIDVQPEQSQFIRSRCPKIRDLVFNTALPILDRTKIRTSFTDRGGSREEISIESELYGAARNVLAATLNNNPKRERKVMEIITKRLERDTSPYDREENYASLGVFPVRDMYEGYSEILREGIIKERHPESIRGIGRAIAKNLKSESKNSVFPRPTLSLTFSLARITEDRMYAISQLPNGKEKLIEKIDYSQGDIKDLRRFEHNAFLALGFSAVFSQDKTYKSNVARFLEKRLHPGELMYSDLDLLGEKFAVMSDLFRSQNDSTVESRLKNLASKMGNLVEFDPLKVKDNKTHLRRTNFAESMYQLAPSGKRRAYRNYLSSIGFSNPSLFIKK